jgi:hypothetical protein
MYWTIMHYVLDYVLEDNPNRHLNMVYFSFWDKSTLTRAITLGLGERKRLVFT